MLDIKTKNITVFSALVLVLSIQLVIVLAVIFSFIPIKLDSFVYTMSVLYLDQVRPHRQLQIFTAFILFGSLLQWWGMVFLKKQLQDSNFFHRLWPFLVMQTVWVAIEITAAFKIFVFGFPAWAKWFLYVSLGAWMLNIIFWPECKRFLQRSYHLLDEPAHALVARYWGEALLIGGMLFLLWPPDITKVLAHDLLWDNFNGSDGFLFSGWGYLHGMAINKDVSSNYDVVLPAFMAVFTKFFGGFNYENFFRMIIIGSLAYYVAVWAFLRYWLKSSLLAAFGFILAVKLQMFHWGNIPMLWRYSSATPVRYLFDLVPVLFIYKHSVSGREKYLWWASLTSGLMMAYKSEVGIYLTVAFYAYVFMLLTMPWLREKFIQRPRDVRKIFAMAVLPFMAGFILIWMVEGHWIWTAEFWKNTTDFEGLVLKGFGSLPYWDGLHDKQYFAFCMGFIMPAVYILTVMVIGAQLYLRQMESPQMFIVYVCIYGMGIYHYFVFRSAVTSYYVVCIPFVFVICFWVQQMLKSVFRPMRRIILAVLVILTFGALVTGYMFTIYPNALNMAGVDFNKEVEFYNKEFNFDKDAALIDRLTSLEDRVAVVSSFETKILMTADRKPFFYWCPMIWSEPMEYLDFQGTGLLTFDSMRKTLGQLENEKPGFVFIEKKLYSGQLPATYYQHYQTLTILIRYLYQHYTPVDQGQYLVALKRK